MSRTIKEEMKSKNSQKVQIFLGIGFLVLTVGWVSSHWFAPNKQVVQDSSLSTKTAMTDAQHGREDKKGELETSESESIPEGTEAGRPDTPVRIVVEDEEQAAEVKALLDYYQSRGEPDLRIKDVKVGEVDYSDRQAQVPYDVPFARLYIDYGRRDTEYLIQESEWAKQELETLRRANQRESSQENQQKLRLAEVRDRAIQKLIDHRKQKMQAYRRLQNIEVE